MAKATLLIPASVPEEIRNGFPDDCVTVDFDRDHPYGGIQPLLRKLVDVRPERLKCQCSPRAPELYVRVLSSGTVILAVMPDTGSAHSQACPFRRDEFEDVKVSEDNGRELYDVRLDFRIGTVKAMPAHESRQRDAGAQPTEGTNKPRGLDLDKVLRLLLHASGLNFWARKFVPENRRNDRETDLTEVFSPIINARLGQGFKKLSFPAEIANFVAVHRGVSLKAEDEARVYLRFDIIHKIFPPKPDHEFGRLYLLGSGQQCFFIKQTVFDALSPVLGATPEYALTAVDQDFWFCAATVVASPPSKKQRAAAEEKGREPTSFIHAEKIAILRANRLGVPIPTSAHEQLIPRLIDARETFTVPLLRTKAAFDLSSGPHRLPTAIGERETGDIVFEPKEVDARRRDSYAEKGIPVEYI
jgi:Protein of unknown function (DUF1173).